MKRKFAVLFSLVALTGLVACGGGTGTSESSNPSTPVVHEGSITFANESYVIEKGGNVTVRVKVDIPGASDLSCNFAVEQDGEIIQLPEITTGLVSIKVTGLNLGKAKIIATSAAYPEIKATADVEVIRPLANLNQAWQRVILNENYTLTSTDESGAVHSVLKVTDQGITLTDGEGNATLSLQDEESNKIDIYGIGVDKNGTNTLYITKKNGELFSTGVALKGQNGLITSSNFKGKGIYAGSWLDVDTSFFGLQAINPSWLTAEKDSTNTYEITGTSADLDSCFVEAMLWQLVDPAGRNAYIESLGGTSFSADQLASAITTTLKVNYDNTVTIQVENQFNKVFTAVMSDVKTTTLDESITTFLSNTEVKLPALSSTMTLMKEAVMKDDFYLYQEDNDGKKLGVYGTTSYMYNDGLYNFERLAESLGVATVDGFVLKNGTTYAFYLNEGNVVIVDEDLELNEEEFKANFGYPSTLKTFNSENDVALYSFGEYDGGIVVSSDKDVNDDFALSYYGMTMPELVATVPEWTFTEYVTQIQTTIAKGSDSQYHLTKMDVSLGGFSVAGMPEGSYILAPLTFDFTGCETTNPIHAKITEAIAAFNPGTGA